MSLDVSLMAIPKEPISVFEANITHNLGEMAAKAGIYKACWRPEEIGCKYAKDIIPLLGNGIKKMRTNPDKFRKYNAPNGWGTYDDFLPWLEEYLKACKENPEAEISVSR